MASTILLQKTESPGETEALKVGARRSASKVTALTPATVRRLTLFA